MRAKILVGKYYLLDNVLVKVLKFTPKFNSVKIKKFDHFNEVEMEADVFEMSAAPMYSMKDATRIIGRSANTIQRYEREGLLPGARKWILNKGGQKPLRFYSEADLSHLTYFFATRNRPGQRRDGHHWKLNRREIREILDMRLKK